MRHDFFLERSFRDMDDLNAQFEDWRVTIAYPRVHATTQRVVDDHFAEKRPHLLPLPLPPYDAVLTVERRISQEGMVAVGGNQYSVPDTTRHRLVEVQNHPAEVRIFEDGRLIASHPVLEGKNQHRVDASHRQPVHGRAAAGRSSRPRRRRLGSSVSPTRDEARADVFDYIERFYKPRRRHSKLGYLSPMEFEARAMLA